MGYNKRYDARTDQNHASLLKNIRTIPRVTVCDLGGTGSGCPDVMLGFMGCNYLLEIKRPDVVPSASKLNDMQVEWHDKWTGQVAIVRTFDDVLKVLGLE